jgi:integrase
MSRPRGQIQQITKGKKYRIRVTVGYDRFGNQRTKSRTIHGSRKEAQKELTRLQGDVDAERLRDTSDITLDAYLDDWIKKIEGTVRPKTHYDYAAQMTRYVRPTLGHLKLSDIRLRDIESVYTGMRAKGLSSRTIRLTHVILRKALKKAYQLEYITRNPTDGAELPEKTRTREPQYLSKDEVCQFLSVAEGHKWELLFLVLLFTGLRISEAVALRARDVNIKGSSLLVRRSAVQTQGVWHYRQPKNKRGRSILLPHFLTHRLAATLPADPDALLFSNNKGHPADVRSLRRTFRSLLRKAGLPEQGLHSTRHTHATILLEDGKHPKVVQERLGHQSSSITQDIYSHVIPSMQGQLAIDLERMWQQFSETTPEQKVA